MSLCLCRSCLSLRSLYPGCQLQTLIYICRLSVSAQFNYLLRTVPPPITHVPASELDHALISFITAVMDPIKAPHPGDPEAFARQTMDLIFLPIRNGGCGFQSASNTLRPAYVGSWALCGQSIASLNPSIEDNINSRRPWPAFSAYTSALSEITSLVKDAELLRKLSPDLLYRKSKVYLLMHTPTIPPPPHFVLYQAGLHQADPLLDLSYQLETSL